MSKKSNPHTLSSYGTQKGKEEVVDNDLVYEIKKKAIESLQEDSIKSMYPPRVGKKRLSILWRPNNYRRQIRVKTKTGVTINHLRKTFDISEVEEEGCNPQNDITIRPPPCFKFNEQNKFVSVKNYKGITIVYGKDNLIGIFSQNIINGVKETYLIDADSIEELDKRLLEKKEEIRNLIDNALLAFSKDFNINIPYMIPIWLRHEDWIKGEDYIDNLPADVIIHDTVFKKVYGSGIEFIGGKDEEPVAHMKNYIKNRAVEDVAPEIVKELSVNRELIEGILEVNASTSKVLNDWAKSTVPILQDFSANIKTHNRVLKGINSSFRKFNSLLQKGQQKKLGDYF